MPFVEKRTFDPYRDRNVTDRTVLFSDGGGKRVNRMSDDEWQIFDPVTQESFQLDFNIGRLGDLSTKSHLIIKQAIFALSPITDSEGLMYWTQGACTHLIDDVIKLLEVAEHYEWIKLKAVTRVQWIQAVRRILIPRKTPFMKKNHTCLSKSAAEDYVYTINRLHDLYLKGQLTDAPSVTLSLDEVFEEAREFVIQSGLDYVKWLRGGSFSKIGVPQAMLLLSEAIEIIQSDKTLCVKAFYKWINNNSHTFPHDINHVLTDLKKTYGYSQKAYVASTEKCKSTVSGSLRGKTNSKPPQHPLYWEITPLVKTEFEDAGREVIDVWPFNQPKELKEHTRLIYDASLIIFLCLTGIRRNELEPIGSNDIFKDQKGNYCFRSDINKTNLGVTTVRYFAGIVAECTQLLIELSTENKISNNIPLFKMSHPCSRKDSQVTALKKNGHTGNPINIATQTNSLSHLSLFLDYIASQYGEAFMQDFEIEHLTPHMFRHTWAEFALRRFDGDGVKEAIRSHFRHHYGSYMTDEYLSGKITEEESTLINRSYLVELMGRYIEGEIDLFGPIGQWIKQRLSEFKFLSNDELATFAEEFSGKIEPHEYGFCVLRDETQVQAKCYNKKTGLAETDEARWHLCGGCVHRLTLGSQREDILRIGMSIQETINFFEAELKIPSIVAPYYSSLKRAEAAINEIDGITDKESN